MDHFINVLGERDFEREDTPVITMTTKKPLTGVGS